MVEYVMFYEIGEEFPFFTIKVRSKEDFLKTYIKRKDIEFEVLSEKEFKEFKELE